MGGEHNDYYWTGRHDLTAGDLCYAAAEKLISDLGWNKDEIDILVFVSQHADYILPATACILQLCKKFNKF